MQADMTFSNMDMSAENDKMNKMTWAPSEESDQPGHSPVWSVFTEVFEGS